MNNINLKCLDVSQQIIIILEEEKEKDLVTNLNIIGILDLEQESLEENLKLKDLDL